MGVLTGGLKHSKSIQDSWTSAISCLTVLRFNVQLSVVEVLGVLEAKGDEADQAAEQLERLLFILHTLMSHREGAKVTKPEAVCQVGGEH